MINHPDKNHIIDFFKNLQDSICKHLEEYDEGCKFREDNWNHHSGGGGRSRIISGRKIEKGGVNFSAVEGQTSAALQQQLQLATGANFTATGVSIVLHPTNPFVPIIHMNVRYFELTDGTYWFGGGIDLTPHYVFPEDASYFHNELKKVCDKHHPDYYHKFKRWADDYFYLPHRDETRGVGGIFFDYLMEPGTVNNDATAALLLPKANTFAFVEELGGSFARIYTSIATKRSGTPFSEHNKQWQFVRRGRYVEFNLVWDRGTKFGLETGGRTESILMSLPPTAQWFYDYEIKENTAEEISQRYFKKGIDWETAV